jgi:hypothetical protein
MYLKGYRGFESLSLRHCRADPNKSDRRALLQTPMAATLASQRFDPVSSPSQRTYGCPEIFCEGRRPGYFTKVSPWGTAHRKT